MNLQVHTSGLKEMKFEMFLSLAEELQSYILSFLPWRDILRCTSVCKALRRTYNSSSELQYIIELGGQRLLPVPNSYLDNHTAIATRLQLLRDKADAWFNFDNRSFKTVSIPKQFYFAKKIVVDGHLCLWQLPQEEEGRHSANLKIFPILPKPLQQTVERDWSQRLSRSVLDAHLFDMFIVPAKNLVAIAHASARGYLRSGNENFYIDLRTLDRDGVHPNAAGPRLFLSEVFRYESSTFVTKCLRLKCLGRHIAFWRSLVIGDALAGNTVAMSEQIWLLQIWDWQRSTTSNSILGGVTDLQSDESVDFCFLGGDRLLIINDDSELKLYSIEDIFQVPQPLARFLLPLSTSSTIRHLRAVDNVAHISEWPNQAQHAMWASDPEHRLLCLTAMSASSQVFIISTNIFFDLDLFEGMDTPITWENWGPSNARIFSFHYPWRVGISGNRVTLLFRARHTLPHGAPRPNTKYKLHVMDFSPLAVKRRRGLGRVVKEPSKITDAGRSIMTSLPYVEVVSDRTFSFDDSLLLKIWVEMDRIILLTDSTGRRQLEVIEV